MAYLLDADVFIRAKNLHYGLDFCPAFWEWLAAEHRAGNLYSVEKVGDELQAVADELSAWAAQADDGFFLRPDAAVFPALATVSGWVQSQQYTPSAVSTFLQVADYYLVAQARSGGHTVVTHEVPSASTRRIKIPDACIGLGIKVRHALSDVADGACALRSRPDAVRRDAHRRSGAPVDAPNVRVTALLPLDIFTSPRR